MTHHLGCEKWNQDLRENSNNYRNGYSDKKLIGSNGNLEVRIPRDYNATFVPHLVKRYEKDISEIKGKITYMYSCGINQTNTWADKWNIWDWCNKDMVSKIIDEYCPQLQNDKVKNLIIYIHLFL